MLSNRPSPHQTASFDCFNWSRRAHLYFSQWQRIEGNRNFVWWKKYVRMEKTDTPMCLNTSRTLLMEAPAISTAKLSKMLPAGYLPNTNGWLLQMKGGPSQRPHCCSTVTIVPFFVSFTFGFPSLHRKQNKVKRANNMPRNTRNFGSLKTGKSLSMLAKI